MKNGLQVFALQQNRVTKTTRQIVRRIKRRFDCNVIDARGQDTFEVIVRVTHGGSLKKDGDAAILAG